MDTRPELERSLCRARVACLLLIFGSAVLGGGLSAVAILYITKDRSA